MIDPKQETYLMKTLDEPDEHIQQLQTYAQDHRVPIMEPLGIEFLEQLIRMKQPKRILEIGAAIGYSAIRMAQCYPHSEIVTVEREEQRYHEAVQNIQDAQLENRINVVFGDALEVSDDLLSQGPYDVLFIDAAKGQYQRFFELFTPSLAKDGVIISDNVLFKGYVADNPNDGSNKAKIARKIEAYNEWLIQHPDFKTNIVPIGDGVAISTKR
ncbi:O-methyltransferase [Pontibacillus marinus]|uniref:tRNA 5-hydroxyuridine methyltransferase n=1 Tax=Pontibacillus marinus BH030004 = DSM 16465 TaxID=1385511 RepID=A0A0A5G0X2_9BACI|nr:O-methyltransferase [Pontibacillus marinus]KGX84720.1 SAM-dependent methyltransferase [Pontibacillus marinus BH030004 = DSM 16465]